MEDLEFGELSSQHWARQWNETIPAKLEVATIISSLGCAQRGGQTRKTDAYESLLYDPSNPVDSYLPYP